MICETRRILRAEHGHCGTDIVDWGSHLAEALLGLLSFCCARLMKVLLAEDSLTMRRLLASQLRGWNYEVTEAADGTEAWEAFESGDFTLVLTDWVMPGMDGVDLIRRIRADDRPEYVYVILLTARSENENLVEAMEAGADDFLGKPCNPKELRVRLLAGERIVNLELELIRQNQKLLDTQAALIQSEKLAGVGQLAAGMAHEINNPIAFVTNNLAVLQRDVQSLLQLTQDFADALPKFQSADLDTAAQLRKQQQQCDLPWLHENLPQLFQSSRDGLFRVREIVNNLRDFAHLDEADSDIMNVANAMRSTLQILAAETSEKQITVDTDIDGDLTIACRPAKLKQVFHSLLLNAIQASEDGQTIRVNARQEDDHAVIRIEDEGCGIDDNTRKHLFEPFYTTRKVGAGHGLGLAVSYGVIRDHGGSIDVETMVGEGTTFTISLPV